LQAAWRPDAPAAGRRRGAPAPRRALGALAAAAGAALTFAVGARDLLALDGGADARYLALPLAREAQQRVARYRISSGRAAAVGPAGWPGGAAGLSPEQV